MVGAAARRYCAFISYSHRDRAAGDRLFKHLDGYRPPKALVGRETPFGPVPARLYPVFRDREELSASPALAGRLEGALAASDHLVVVCSPAAAASGWVNEEIRMFRSSGRGERIHAALVDGEPAEAFPAALREGEGGLPLATDLRAQGDGWNDGPLKVIAGILGLGFGELKDREIARARARARRNAAIAALFAVLAIVAGISTWRAVERTREAEAQLSRAEAAILVAVEGVARIAAQVEAGSRSGAVPSGRARSLLSAADAMVTGVVALAPGNPRLLEEQGKLLILFARYYGSVGDFAAARDAAVRALSLFGGREAYSGAARSRSAALIELGDALAATGDRSEAITVYEESLDIFRRIAAADPGDLWKARDVAVTLERIGDLRMGYGDRAGALQAYEQSLGTARRSAAADAGNLVWTHDVWLGLDNIGDVRLAMGDSAGALQAYDESLDVARRLAAREPDGTAWTSEVAISLQKTGDARRQLGDSTGALQAYHESLRFARELTAADPRNAISARHMAILLERIGDLRMRASERAGALQAYEESYAIRQQWAAVNPSDVEWARDLSISLQRIGDVRVAAGDRAGALQVYEDSLVIRRRLAAADLENTKAARDLYLLLLKFGQLYEGGGERATAAAYYREALERIQRLVALDPGNGQWTKDRTVLAERLAAVQEQ